MIVLLNETLMRNYNDLEYKKWRKLIKKRDNHTCQWPNCNSRRKIHAHHILTWASFPGLRYHPHNGISLCKNHHDLIKNDEESYITFFQKIIYTKYYNT